MCFLNLKLMFLTTHFITFALTFSTNISWTLYLLSNQPKQTCCRWDRCLFWLSLCQIKRHEEHLQVVARGTQSQTVNFLNVIALVFLCLFQSLIINNKLHVFLIQFIVNIWIWNYLGFFAQKIRKTMSRSTPDILCWQHCDKLTNILCFSVPPVCPLCHYNTTHSPSRIPPYKLPSPLTNAGESPVSLVVRPTVGTFLRYVDNLISYLNAKKLKEDLQSITDITITMLELQGFPVHSSSHKPMAI